MYLQMVKRDDNNVDYEKLSAAATQQSEQLNVDLRKAFNWAGLSKTTYYRQL